MTWTLLLGVAAMVILLALVCALLTIIARELRSPTDPPEDQES